MEIGGGGGGRVPHGEMKRRGNKCKI